MASRTIKIVTREYDAVTPLLTGDVVPEGIDLRFDRSKPFAAFLTDESYQAGEMSFARYVRRLDAGEKDIIGLPIFIMRGFRQRCFFVRRGSELSSFQDLRSKRIGTNGWPDSGNTWSRALLRDEGVSIDEIDWLVGPIDGEVDEAFSQRVTSEGLPPNVKAAPVGETLAGMLAAGELDALMMPWPPQSFNEPDGQIVRLLNDYQSVEEEYARKVGYCPPLHVVGMRASVIEQDPQIAGSLFNAFDEARKLSEQYRWILADTSPWLQADMERAVEILGPNWQAYGVAGNEPAIDTFCEELHAQGITSRRIPANEVFADFANLTATA